MQNYEVKPLQQNVGNVGKDVKKRNSFEFPKTSNGLTFMKENADILKIFL